MRRLFGTSGFRGPGGDLLSRALRHSTIGAEGFHGRVRDGIGCWGPRYGHQVDEARSSCMRLLQGDGVRRAIAAARGGRPCGPLLRSSRSSD